jgi:hypothetical protein
MRARRFRLASKLVVLGIACGFAVSSARASYIVTLEQVGSDVVMTGNGAIDLNGLTGGGFPCVFCFQQAGIDPSLGQIFTAPFGGIIGFTGFTGPTSFGTGGFTAPTIATGDGIGIDAEDNTLFINAFITNNGQATLSSSATYSKQTLSSLGVTPGIYEWTWGTGPNQNFTLDIIASGVPESGSTLGLLLVALIGLLGASRIRGFRLV